MTAPIVDPVATPVMEALHACLDDQIRQVPDPPANVVMRTGDSVELLISQYQNECCDGLAWVRLVTVYPSTNFPAADEVWTRCPGGWAVVVELGAARCAPTGDLDTIPTPDEWEAASRAVMGDLAAIRRAFMCFHGLEDFRYRPMLVGQWQQARTEGGCVGGAMTVTVHMPYCDVLEES